MFTNVYLGSNIYAVYIVNLYFAENGTIRFKNSQP